MDRENNSADSEEGQNEFLDMEEEDYISELDEDYQLEEDQEGEDDDDYEDLSDDDEMESDIDQQTGGTQMTLGQAYVRLLQRNFYFHENAMQNEITPGEIAQIMSESKPSGEQILRVNQEYNNLSHRPDFQSQITSLLQDRKLSPIIAQSPWVISAQILPSSDPKVKTRFNSRAYCGKFSDNGDLFYSATQDFRIHIYDSSDVFGNWELTKDIEANEGRWTITDATLNSSNTLLAYTSITPIVNITSLQPEDTHNFMFNLAATSDNQRFGIWSVRFSPDGKELVVGTSDHSVCVYDIPSQKILFKIRGHQDDVNSVCFSSKNSNVVLSGSDDTLIKVWDRRQMQTCAGCLPGHTEGITYISSRGDDRYVLSNSKDQTMKLWDLRNLVSQSSYDFQLNDMRLDWDYRFMSYPYRKRKNHPQDSSIMSFVGHSVLKTLIRCDFSPANTTGGQFFYTGSDDGRVYIYDLNGEIIRSLPVSLDYDQSNEDNYTVRDVSWHPEFPVIAATSWNGTVLQFEFKS